MFKSTKIAITNVKFGIPLSTYLNTQKLIMVIPKLRMGRTLQIALKLLVKNGDKRMGGG